MWCIHLLQRGCGSRESGTDGERRHVRGPDTAPVGLLLIVDSELSGQSGRLEQCLKKPAVKARLPLDLIGTNPLEPCVLGSADAVKGCAARAALLDKLPRDK